MREPSDLFDFIATENPKVWEYFCKEYQKKHPKRFKTNNQLKLKK